MIGLGSPIYRRNGNDELLATLLSENVLYLRRLKRHVPAPDSESTLRIDTLDPGAAQDAGTLAYRINVTEQELMRRYRKLSDRQQQAVAEIITALASKETRR